MKGKNDVVSGVLLGTVATIYLLTAYKIQIPLLLQATSLNAASVPKLWGWGLLILSIALMARGIKTALQNRSEKGPVSVKKSVCKFLTDNRDVMLSILLLILYIALLEPVGFIICTTVYIFSSVILLSPTGTVKKHLASGAVLAVLFSVVLAFIFVRLLSMPLPQGLLGW